MPQSSSATRDGEGSTPVSLIGMRVAVGFARDSSFGTRFLALGVPLL
jgi:hypothetical protein